jgi:hypothetical protein
MASYILLYIRLATFENSTRRPAETLPYFFREETDLFLYYDHETLFCARKVASRL